MPAGPIGSVWALGTWSDTAWEENTWADQGDIVSGSFAVETNGALGTFAGRVAKFGGTQNGPSIFERTKARIRDVEGAFHVGHTGARFSATGSVVNPRVGTFALAHGRRVVRMTGKVDLTPIVEEEAFILGLMLGDSDE